MSKHLRVMILAFWAMLFSAAVNAEVLATGQLMMPLIPDGSGHTSIPVPKAVDPNKPVWVVYQLTAISAESDPEGEVVLDSSFEMVATPMGDSYVVFKARDAKVEKSAGTLGEKLKALVGDRSPEELKTIFGEEMYAAYEALNKKEGSYVSASIQKNHQVGDKKELVLLVSVERAKGIQPVLINVAIGQGEIPAQYQSSGISSLAIDKLVAVIIAFFIGLLIWFVRRR